MGSVRSVYLHFLQNETKEAITAWYGSVPLDDSMKDDGRNRMAHRPWRMGRNHQTRPLEAFVKGEKAHPFVHEDHLPNNNSQMGQSTDGKNDSPVPTWLPTLGSPPTL